MNIRFPTQKQCLSALQQTALTLGKVVIVPIELTLIGALFACKSLSSLFFKPAPPESMPNITNHLASLTDELCKIAEITISYGIFPENEALQSKGNAHYVKIEPKIEKVSTPILYAPGYLDTPDTLRKTCRKIANETGQTVYIVKYRSLFQSIDEHAKDFKAVVDIAVQEKNTTSIMACGHSMGGLVTGTYLNQNSDQVETKLWITIASPLKGTAIARLGIGACAYQMRPSSEWMQSFQQKQQTITTRSLHIYTKTDHIVPHRSSLRSAVNAENYHCRQVSGHLGVRSCSAVEQKIASFITASCA